jgi:hypothetical protein
MEQVVEEMTLRPPCSINLSYEGHGCGTVSKTGQLRQLRRCGSRRLELEFLAVRGNLRDSSAVEMLLLLLRAAYRAGLSR